MTIMQNRDTIQTDTATLRVPRVVQCRAFEVDWASPPGRRTQRHGLSPDFMCRRPRSVPPNQGRVDAIRWVCLRRVRPWHFNLDRRAWSVTAAVLLLCLQWTQAGADEKEGHLAASAAPAVASRNLSPQSLCISSTGDGDGDPAALPPRSDSLLEARNVMRSAPASWWNTNQHLVFECMNPESSGVHGGESPVGVESIPESVCGSAATTIFPSIASSVTADASGQVADWGGWDVGLSGEDCEASESGAFLADGTVGDRTRLAQAHGPAGPQTLQNSVCGRRVSPESDLVLPGMPQTAQAHARQHKGSSSFFVVSTLGAGLARGRGSGGSGPRGDRSRKTMPCFGLHRPVSAVNRGQGAARGQKHSRQAGGSMQNMASVSRRRRGLRHCAHAEGCDKFASFGDPAKPSGDLFCKQHKDAAHCNVVSKRCGSPGCDKRPIFGDPATGAKEFCRQHKLDFHVDCQNKRCHFPSCTKHPVFGDPFHPLPRNAGPDCAASGTDSMTDSVEGPRSGFSTAGGRGEPKFCAQHKLEYHVDVRHRRCQWRHGGQVCSKLPSFGDPGRPVPRFCRAHKLEGQVYLAARRPRAAVGAVAQATPVLAAAPSTLVC